MEKSNFKQSLSHFTKKYGINENLIYKYFEAMELNDIFNMSNYEELLNRECPRYLQTTLKEDLKELLRLYKKRE